MHPVMQVVFLSCVVLTMLALAAGTGALWVTGGDPAKIADLANPNVTMSRAEILVLNNANQILGFFGAAWAFAALVGTAHLGGFFLHRPAWKWVGLAAVLAVGMSPVLDLTFRLNEWLLVPGSPLHTWAGDLEAQAAALTEQILRFSSTAEGVAVLISVAFLPALCEEWLFRGTLQPLLIRATGNVHAGVWLTAAVFSAIHLQFFGFLPRMLLGALFGYLVAHSRSLWPAIISHFVNNGTVVVMAWVGGAAFVEDGLKPQPLASWEWTDWWLAAGGLLLLGWGLATLRSTSNPKGYVRDLLTPPFPGEGRLGRPAQTLRK